MAEFHIAAESGHLECVRLLIENGANVDVREERGMTALELARSAGHEEVVSMLNNL